MAVLQFLLNVESYVLVHRTVMPCDQISEERAQFLNDGLRHLSGVGKHQGGGVGADQISDGLNVVLKHLRHRKVTELWMRDEDVQVEFPGTRDFRNRYRCGLAPCLTVVAADEVLRHGFKRLHGSRDTDSLNGILEQ